MFGLLVTENNMATRKKKEQDLSRVVKGSHLTVTTFSDGTTKLEWDWDALVKEVREACKDAELTAIKPNIQTKATRKKKDLAK